MLYTIHYIVYAIYYTLYTKVKFNEKGTEKVKQGCRL